jgi:hypothetical protein
MAASFIHRNEHRLPVCDECLELIADNKWRLIVVDGCSVSAARRT